ncbi:MAG: hypothetical protein JO119_20160 [Acidobacteria bacterium]|nr:hypothetical protein [Acidobacteriota bacterium]
MPVLAQDWYDAEPDLTSFYQGDIIRDVPIIFLPDKISKWLLLRPDPKSKKHIDDVLGGEICKWFESFPEGQLADKWQYGEREEFVAAKALMINVMVLTQTCDLENRSYYQIAPIYPEARQKKIENLRNNDLTYAFFLPATAPYITENSYVELSHTCVAPKAYFPKNGVSQRLAARLSNEARTALQEKIAEYFGRPFGFSGRDRARETAEHTCVTCFYRHGELSRQVFQAGANFTACDRCETIRWIRVIPRPAA